MTHDVLVALDRLEDYLQRVRAFDYRQDVYQSMSDSEDLAEIAGGFTAVWRRAGARSQPGRSMRRDALETQTELETSPSKAHDVGS